jgi:hypothetical protein
VNLLKSSRPFFVLDDFPARDFPVRKTFARINLTKRSQLDMFRVSDKMSSDDA